MKSWAGAVARAIMLRKITRYKYRVTATIFEGQYLYTCEAIPGTQREI